MCCKTLSAHLRLALALAAFTCLCEHSLLAQSAATIDAGQYATLQQAADAIPDAGGVLYIPAGNYELDEPLRIRTGDTKIVGVGSATHLINRNEKGSAAIIIENPEFAGRATPSANRLWRVTVADLRVTGNDRSGAGIEANYIEEIFVHGVSSSYNGGDGIKLNACYEDPRLANNLFTYNKGYGVSLDGCHDIIVSANQFEENETALFCSDSFNLTMTGNNLDDHLKDGVVIENTYGSVLSGNMIEECQGWAVVLDRDCYGITVSANVIAHDFGGGIDLRDAHGCAISANTFTIVKNAALAIRSASGSITVTGNNFSDTWIGMSPEGAFLQRRDNKATATEDNPNEATGVLLDGCSAVVLTGNLFSRLTTQPIVRKGECTKILVSANGSQQDAGGDSPPQD